MNSVKKDFDDLLQKQMDRRDFLKHVGIGFVALTGVATILKTLSTLSGKQQGVGYGASAYGGARPKNNQS